MLLFLREKFQGKVPSIWKEANVTATHRKNDPSDAANYRPISLLAILKFLRDHNILTSLQSSFIPGDSTVNKLVDIYDTFCKALDEGK